MGRSSPIVLRLIPDARIRKSYELRGTRGTVRQILGGKPEDSTKAIETDFKENMDRGMKDVLEGKPERGDLAVEALESMSRDQFEASWKVDFNSKGRPAGEVLRDLAKALGRRARDDPDPGPCPRQARRDRTAGALTISGHRGGHAPGGLVSGLLGAGDLVRPPGGGEFGPRDDAVRGLVAARGWSPSPGRS